MGTSLPRRGIAGSWSRGIVIIRFLRNLKQHIIVGTARRNMVSHLVLSGEYAVPQCD